MVAQSNSDSPANENLALEFAVERSVAFARIAGDYVERVLAFENATHEGDAFHLVLTHDQIEDAIFLVLEAQIAAGRARDAFHASLRQAS